jgi:hypothetical protein
MPAGTPCKDSSRLQMRRNTRSIRHGWLVLTSIPNRSFHNQEVPARMAGSEAGFAANEQGRRRDLKTATLPATPLCR